jgi:chromate transporter
VDAAPAAVPLRTIAKEWGRIGSIGFGGPPTHIALLRQLCVKQRRWISEPEFADAVATVNLLPGPASTQLAIFCAWRLRGWAGALVGGFFFITPGLIAVLALSAVFLATHPPRWVDGAAAGAGAAVAAVALNAALSLAPTSWRRAGLPADARAGTGTGGGGVPGSQPPPAERPPAERTARRRALTSGQAWWLGYAAAGAVCAAWAGPYVVLALLASGFVAMTARSVHERRGPGGTLALVPLLSTVAPAAGLGALAWVALKVGALSYGGGFVIIPLMQADAVHHYHWMTSSQFLNAVALGQVTPGPVVQTVAVVGYAADKLVGGLMAAAIAFAPSFCFVMFGGRHFDRLRSNVWVQDFLSGAGPAAIGAIAGSAIPLALALAHLWQVGVLAAALVWFVVFRRNLVLGLLTAGALGVAASFAGLRVT